MRSIKAIFPEGVTALTVNGLHQWDYGRKLKIKASDLPVAVEVHFACPGMDEAVVRVCEAVSGVVEAVIPDRCLEQTAPVTAWVFEINGSTGVTTKTVTLPVTPRAKPQPGSTIPEEYTDRYTELLTEMQAAIQRLGEGDVNVPYAVKAGHADYAEFAPHAAKADKADMSGAATLASQAQTLIVTPQVFTNTTGIVTVTLDKSSLYAISYEFIGTSSSSAYTFILYVGQKSDVEYFSSANISEDCIFYKFSSASNTGQLELLSGGNKNGHMTVMKIASI